MSQDWWNEDRVAQLKQLCEMRLSSGAIAKALGATRNAVIGKILRSGLHLLGESKGGGYKGPRKPKAAQAIRLPKPMHRHAPAAPTPLRSAPPRPHVPPIVVGIAAPKSRRVGLVDLVAGDCRYPHGEGRTTLFCGAAQTDDSSYCAYHAKLCLAGVPPRRELRHAMWSASR